MQLCIINKFNYNYYVELSTSNERLIEDKYLSKIANIFSFSGGLVIKVIAPTSLALTRSIKALLLV